jgi:hypothetical protein
VARTGPFPFDRECQGAAWFAFRVSPHSWHLDGYRYSVVSLFNCLYSVVDIQFCRYSVVVCRKVDAINGNTELSLWSMCSSISPSCKRSTPGEQVDQEQDDGHYQQEMDKPAANMQCKADQPQYEEYCDDRPKKSNHFRFLLDFSSARGVLPWGTYSPGRCLTCCRPPEPTGGLIVL